MNKKDLLCSDCVHRTECPGMVDKVTGCEDYYPYPPKRSIRHDFRLQWIAKGIVLGLCATVPYVLVVLVLLSFL